MYHPHPSPEEMLAHVPQEEQGSRLGKLKIFLGAASGVGKTYTMLETAQHMLKEGRDLVAGCVVTHGRQETEALLKNIEVIPEVNIEYNGAVLTEFNLDAVLTRKPKIVLVDELAHTNVPGSRHDKRWQDVDELLGAGINVLTTLNVQHLESVNDLIAQITGIKVQETVPDYIFEKAYEVEVVDLPPDDLIQRIKEGKVYRSQTDIALKNFFRKPNLIALRELSLRVTAEHVDAQMQRYRPKEKVWPVAERLLVCIGPGPFSVRLIRAAKRMATSLRSSWLAVFIETPGTIGLSDKSRSRLARTMRLAQRLGAETVTLAGRHIAEELVHYAQKRNVSKIIIGKPVVSRWRNLLFGSIVDDLIRLSGNIDVYVISGDKVPQDHTFVEQQQQPNSIQSYLYSIAIVACATVLVRLVVHHLALMNLAMIYQLAVVIIALRFGKGPSILAACLSVAILDFFFVPPYLSFAVSDVQYIITLLVMLTVGLALSTLTSALKQQIDLSRRQEQQTAALYALTRAQLAAHSRDAVINISIKHIMDVFDSKVCLLLSDKSGQLALVEHPYPTFALDPKETGVAQWVFLNKQSAGLGTDTLGGAQALYVPLNVVDKTIGVVGILPSKKTMFENPDQSQLLETFVNQMALAIDRAG